MQSEVCVPVMAEYEAMRRYLATADISINDLFEKTLQMLNFISNNHIGKEHTDE